MLKPVRTVAPAKQPVTLDEAKDHCHVVDADSDAVIGRLIDAATSLLDGRSGTLGRCLITQTWRQDFTAWKWCLRLPFPDVQAISSVVYSDSDNAEQTVSSSLYELLDDECGSYVHFLQDFTVPSLYSDRSDRIRVTFTAGYGDDPSDVPQAIRQAILLTLGDWFMNRGNTVAGQVSQISHAATALTAPFRRNIV